MAFTKSLLQQIFIIGYILTVETSWTHRWDQAIPGHKFIVMQLMTTKIFIIYSWCTLKPVTYIDLTQYMLQYEKCAFCIMYLRKVKSLLSLREYACLSATPSVVTLYMMFIVSVYVSRFKPNKYLGQ